MFSISTPRELVGGRSLSDSASGKDSQDCFGKGQAAGRVGPFANKNLSIRLDMCSICECVAGGKRNEFFFAEGFFSFAYKFSLRSELQTNSVVSALSIAWAQSHKAS